MEFQQPERLDWKKLTERFFERGPEIVARELLGCRIVRRIRNDRRSVWVGGIIVETEAYLGEDDPASHSARGRVTTTGKPMRHASMFGPPGRFYVYAIHAKHCLNWVTQGEGVGSAVLIRAMQPVWSIDVMKRYRSVQDERRLTSGPGMICQSLDIDRRFDGLDALSSPDWRTEAPSDPPKFEIKATPRVGITRGETLPLRFFVSGNRFVSGPLKQHD
ncbi:DNA-3-methyladenine glycosylase [Neorhodopirellula pilleata]|uniref:Putative 3-methyladenine DNA glycosylase n=1 Tax=Neorhodopirellula pilleata TaxID=2714738 RepID=A0A5C6A732_9BACT|nr:DNA-3-methyladenine glycosylase [Neorhodopirellula pilleata]TWT95714.1 3-methyladenine DNA glycosylase [Neorhodopirellula pilleata]